MSQALCASDLAALREKTKSIFLALNHAMQMVEEGPEYQVRYGCPIQGWDQAVEELRKELQASIDAWWGTEQKKRDIQNSNGRCRN